jgi:hypothetical protein
MTKSGRNRPSDGPTGTPPTAPPTASNWAGPVSQLEVSEAPTDALNLNVAGRPLAGPAQGFGQLWQKTYRVRLTGAEVTPQTVIRIWKEHFGDFWPKGNHFYAPLTRLQPGEVVLLNLALPGKMTLSTGMLVIYADDQSFAFMTPEGHPFASVITFSSYADAAVPIVQIQALLRASDPLYELSMPIMAQRNEDRFWNDTLRALATHFGVSDATVEMLRVCVDRRRQWRYAGNIRHNAAIRTTLYKLTHPRAWFAHHGDA